MTQSPRCAGKSRQTGERCKLPPIPFGDYCRYHSGGTAMAREKARLRMLDYELWSPDPYYIKRERIREWRRSQRTWEMRKARKAGPQAVAQLLAERGFEKTEQAQIADDNARARAAKREAHKREGAQQNGKPDPAAYDDQPGYVSYESAVDWGDL